MKEQKDLNIRERAVFQAIKRDSNGNACRLRDYEIAMYSYVKKKYIPYVLKQLEKKGFIRRFTKTTCPMMGREGYPCSDREIIII